MGRRSALLVKLTVNTVALIAVFSACFLPSKSTCSPVKAFLGTPLIVGGVPASPGEFPWMVSIQTRVMGSYMHACGGTIVNANHVVTAAHCLPEVFDNGDFRLVAGAHFINETESSQQVRGLSRATRHSGYAGDSTPFDIAIIEVNQAFEFNDRVRQLQMPPPDIVASGNCQIAGWGQTKTDSIVMHPVLLKAEIPVIPKGICAQTYPEFHVETQMCAGRTEGGVDACNGDTGGALVCSDLGYKYFAGIPSWGYGCAQRERPGVYTDIAKFIEWIHSPGNI